MDGDGGNSRVEREIRRPATHHPIKSLEEQLTTALQAKANLEGQLESVVDECKATLKDRAELQSKLARAETLRTAWTDN